MYHQGSHSPFTSENSSGPAGFVDLTDIRAHSSWVPSQGMTWQFPTAKMQSDREAAERSWILFYDTKLREERERLAVAAAIQLHNSRQQSFAVRHHQQQNEGYQTSHYSSSFSLRPVSPIRQQPKPIAQQSKATYYYEDPRMLAAAQRSTLIYQQISNTKTSIPSHQQNKSPALDELFVPQKRCLCKDFAKNGKCEAIELQELVIYEPQIAEGHWQYHWGTFTSSSSSSRN
jgi:hypothetical protein